MIVGITATALTFVSLIVSVVAYYLYYKRDEGNLLSLARFAFYTASVLIFLQAAMLMWGILNHKFEWMYVFSYSSRSLSLYYLISTFWAGQEGTFLLWLIFGSVYGMIIIRSRKDEEPLVMTFMNLVQAFVVMILVKKNPFAYVWEVNPAGFPAGVIPMDGNGLNPLLQDPWMTIHPPILFSGYSSTMILFAFAMTALIRRNYDNWVKTVFPFALFVGLALGTGIILGGYWAYTTLGWGGYWGWDPVENSSLIPWLTTLALIHGLIIQRKQGGMKKTNIFLALTTFILVLYGSFLTRSGVLTDFSVHSFGSTELNTYLIGFVLLFLAIALVTYLYRVKEVQYKAVQSALFTRESFINFGILILIIFAVFTFIGTSWPIFTGLLADKAESFLTEWYNWMAAPTAILMGVLMALSPIFNWQRSSAEKLKSVIVHGVIAVALGVPLYLLGINGLVSLVITVLAIFLILVNGELVVNMWRRKNYKFGGYLAHVGIGLMLIGIITSSVYDRSTKVTLPMDSDKEVLGYKLTYTGKVPSPDGKDKVMIKINGQQSYAKFYWSDYSQAYMVAPSVQSRPLQDLYISPIQIIPAGDNMSATDQLTLVKGEMKSFEDYQVKFAGYDMGSHDMGSARMKITALIEFYDEAGVSMGTARPAVSMSGNQKEPEPGTIPGSDRQVFINGISVETNSIALAVTKPKALAGTLAGKELLAVEVTIKPLISILWLGTLLMMIGFILSTYQNSRRRPAAA